MDKVTPSGESERQRARKFLSSRGEIGWSEDKVVAFAESESSLARKQEREECAKAWCEVCRDENYAKPEFFQRKDYEHSMWWHRRTKNHHDNFKNIVCCTAAAIHERGRKVEG